MCTSLLNVHHKSRLPKVSQIMATLPGARPLRPAGLYHSPHYLSGVIVSVWAEKRFWLSHRNIQIKTEKYPSTFPAHALCLFSSYESPVQSMQWLKYRSQASRPSLINWRHGLLLYSQAKNGCNWPATFSLLQLHASVCDNNWFVAV